MVDIEFLRENITKYDVCINEFFRDMRDRLEDYEYFEGEREDIKKEIYADAIYLLTYLRIIGFDFTHRDFQRDMELAVKFIKGIQEGKK